MSLLEELRALQVKREIPNLPRPRNYKVMLNGCNGKKRYGNRAHAANDARTITRKKSAGRACEPYLCAGCGGWHVGGIDAQRRRHERLVRKGVFK